MPALGPLRSTERSVGLTRMANGRAGGHFFEIPHAAVYLLIAANILVYALCVRQSGAQTTPGELLFANGAMYTDALARQE